MPKLFNNSLTDFLSTPEEHFTLLENLMVRTVHGDFLEKNFSGCLCSNLGRESDTTNRYTETQIELCGIRRR